MRPRVTDSSPPARPEPKPWIAAIHAYVPGKSRAADGRPLAVDPCFGDGRTPFEDECLAPVHERAWSSPIFVDFAARVAGNPEGARPDPGGEMGGSGRAPPEGPRVAPSEGAER